MRIAAVWFGLGLEVALVAGLVLARMSPSAARGERTGANAPAPASDATARTPRAPRAMPPLGGAPLTSPQIQAVAAYVWALSHPSER